MTNSLLFEVGSDPGTADRAGTYQPFFVAPGRKIARKKAGRFRRLGGYHRVMRLSPSLTSATLLGRLRQHPADQQAWGEFVLRYGPKIYRWCRQWNLQEADAQDVAQNVLLKLAQKLRDFTYDPARSFRAWLKTLTHHALSDFADGRARAVRGSGDSAVVRMLDDLEARADLVQQLEQEF